MLIMSKSVMTESFSRLLLIKTTCYYEERHEPLSTIKLASVHPSPPLRFYLRGGGGCTQAKKLFAEVFVICRIIMAEVSVISQAEGRG